MSPTADDAVVHRPGGPWSSGVATALAVLHDRRPGLGPVHRSEPDDGGESVSWLHGLVPCRPYPPEVRSDQALVSVGRLLRTVHDALAGVPVPGCQRLPGAPFEPAETVCHNDVGPWNVVYREGEAVGLIDWDLAAPGPAGWDLALAAWHHVPLYHDRDAAVFGWTEPPDRRHRLRLLCDAYGRPADGVLLDHVARWHDVNEAMVAWSRRHADHPAARPWLKVDLAGVARDRRWLRSHGPSLLGQ